MKNILSLIFFLLNSVWLIAQVPNNQDCLGAIPICQSSYSNQNSYVGTGNYATEINSYNSCLGQGEKNDVWYTFTVTTSGSLRFLITPVDLYDDYDWAVYNLTTANCSEIYNNSSLEVSCNYSGLTGTTGPNGGSGAQYNAAISVTAGQTYVINVSNFSSSQAGYTIDFSASSAVIFDNVPPHIQSVHTPITCGSNNITFDFSENILCSTVQSCDFKLTGPGGPYTINGISGAACNAGGQQENTFNITVNPPITTSGNFYLHLLPVSTCGSVTDLCGNTAPADSLMFVIGGVTANITIHTDDTCGFQNGSATVVGSGGAGVYTYHWDTNPVQTTANIQNLNAGIYHVTVTSNGCSGVDSVAILSIGNMQLSTSSVADTCNVGHGRATVIATGGVGTYSYVWNTTPIQSSPTALNILAGNYSVTVSSGACSLSNTVVVSNVGSILSSTTSTTEVCGNATGTASVIAQGGMGTFVYVWSTNPPQTFPTAVGLSSGSYHVTVSSGGCVKTDSVSINSIGSVSINSMPKIDEVCGLHNATVSVIATGGSGSGNFTYNWNTISPSDSSAITQVTAGTYKVTVSDGTCNDIDSIVVTNMGVISIINPTYNPATCGNHNGMATVHVDGGTGVNGFTYLWNTQPVQDSSSAINLSPGAYIVTVSQGTCLDTAHFNIVNIAGSTSTTLSTMETCSLTNGTATVHANGGSGQYTYLWSCDPPQTTATATHLDAGVYYVNVFDGICHVRDSVTIFEYDLFNGTLYSEPDHCDQKKGSAKVVITGTSAPCNYLWNTSPMQTTATAVNIAGGSYVVTVHDGVCTRTFTTTVDNIIGPTADFSMSTNDLTEINSTCNFLDQSSGNPTNWTWMIGDSSYITLSQNTEYTFPDTGTYKVTLTIKDFYSCSSSVSKFVHVREISTFYIANAFTPNKDGVNDLFGPEGVNIEKELYSMVIYNRWGNLVFSATDMTQKWDGSFNGKKAQPGVYNYIIHLKPKDSGEKEYVGRVTLLH